MSPDRKRILVVEDEVAIREAVVTYLEHAGYAAEGAENGIEGLDYIKSKSYDLVVLDMKMPYMDGRQFSRSLQEMAVKVPILVITAWDDNQPLQQEAGRLEKTFTLKILLQQVEKILV